MATLPLLQRKYNQVYGHSLPEHHEAIENGNESEHKIIIMSTPFRAAWEFV